MSQTYEKYFVPEALAISDLRIDRAAPDRLRGRDVAKQGGFRGPWTLAIGFAVLVYMLFGWFGQVVRESEGSYGRTDALVPLVDGLVHLLRGDVLRGVLRVLFYVRVLGLPWLADADNSLLWPGFSAAWPECRPGGGGSFTPMAAWASRRSTR